MSYLDPPTPGRLALIAGTIFPAAVIVFELVTGLCAEMLFDPLPTWGHIVLVCLVPTINLLLWRTAALGMGGPTWLIVAAGAGIAVAGSYALLFLPILPFAAIGVLFGIGLLPFAPVLALVGAIRSINDLAAERDATARPLAGGVAIGLALLVLVDLPATATELAVARYAKGREHQASALRLVRAGGDRDLLLRLTYGDTGRATGLATMLVALWTRGLDGRPAGSSVAARELYYRLTGTAFNAAPRPARTRVFQWDEDQGGERVGGRVEGLDLAQSRIDGSIAAADNLGYAEWTLEIANRATQQHEARFTLALPEGAVASRATLWVNGEPREASVAGRGAVRAAYAKVVSARRDPLLVTTAGAQRLLVQAFPILPGTTMKLRIGYTAPLKIAADGSRSLALPAIVERNFDIGETLRHAVWFADGGRDWRRTVEDAALLARRPRIAVAPVAETRRHGEIAGLAVEQTIARVQRRPAALMLLLDGSAGNAAAGAALGEALDAIAPGVPVGIAIAAETPVTIAPAPWSPAQHARVRRAIADTRFQGGQDDGPALVQALARTADPRAVLLWVHGAQPVDFAGSSAAIAQQLERATGLPGLVRYQASPGRAAADGDWFDKARVIDPTGDARADLRSALAELSGAAPGWAVTRRAVAADGRERSAHLVRLWAADAIGAQAGAKGKPPAEAIALARRLNLVTPISGAVVLETDRDYRANGLPVPVAEDVPTVPEPGTWALLILLFAAGGWAVRRAKLVIV